MALKPIFLAGALCCFAQGAAAQTPVWHITADTCRRVTESVLHGRVNDGTDAMMPDNASDTLRRDVRGLIQRLSDEAAVVTQHMRPRMERELAPQRLHGLPITVQLWTFGDREAYLVGCGIRPMGDIARVSIQVYPTTDDILRHLNQELFGRDTEQDSSPSQDSGSPDSP